MNASTALVRIPVRQVSHSGWVALRRRMFEAAMDVAAGEVRVWMEALEGRRMLSAAGQALGASGLATISFPGFVEAYPGAIARTADGGFIVAATVASGTSGSSPQYWALAKFNAGGQRDSSFAGGAASGGVVNSDQSACDYLFVQPDGKFIVVGQKVFNYIVVERFKSDGTPDSTFNGGQPDEISSPPSLGIIDDTEAAWMEPDGKLSLAWTSGGCLCMERLDTDGAPDPTYSANGPAFVDISPSGKTAEFLYDAAPLRGGGGFAYVGLHNDNGVDPATEVSLERVQFDDSGDVVSSKVIEVPFPAGGEYTEAVAAPDGSAFFVTGAQIEKLNALGQPDGTFGENGFVNAAGLESIAPDGRLYVLAGPSGEVNSARLNSDGTVDPTFNNGEPLAVDSELPLFFPDGSFIDVDWGSDAPGSAPSLQLTAVGPDGSLPPSLQPAGVSSPGGAAGDPAAFSGGNSSAQPASSGYGSLFATNASLFGDNGSNLFGDDSVAN